MWASRAARVELVLDDGREVALATRPRGYFAATVEGAPPGTRYRYRLHPHGSGDPLERPDPASRWQPDGVHGASAVVDLDFAWTDAGWHGLPTRELVIYELHVGTFTAEGTFDAAIGRLDDLAALGVTAVEVMPIAQFPGERNWGYDGVHPFAAQSSYGGPDGFRRLVDACHGRGLAVVLDVVYNHFGPEGAYQSDFADYLTDRYGTPWGRAINVDGPGSDEVRRYLVENALWWTDGCRVDALRLDAVHAIFDRSATHVLAELAAAVHDRAERSNRRVQVIAESDLNDPRLVRAREVGGYGLDAAWCDDAHHAVHALFTGERDGYYGDFGRASQVATALRDGYVIQGGYSVFRERSHGAPPHGVPGERFVVFAQNHDQVGNRRDGERLTALLGLPALKAVAATVVLSPYLPLLFMGEEYGEPAPFLYFVSHTDPELVAAVRAGRREEFAGFRWTGEPPDPQAPETFARSRLDWSLREAGHHAELLAWYRDLLRLRRDVPALAALSRERIAVVADDEQRALAWRRWHGGSHALVAVNAGAAAARLDVALPAGTWRLELDATGDAPASLDAQPVRTAGEDGSGHGGLPGSAPDGRATVVVPGSGAVVYLHDR